MAGLGGAWTGGEQGSAEDRARRARYAEALAFYGGDQWTGRRQRGETRLTLNYARTLIRKVASYVFPGPVTFSVPVGEAAGRDGEEAARSRADQEVAARRAELALTELADELDLARLDVALCVDAAVLGDAALKVTWDANAAGPGGRGRPSVAPVDPATLTAWWAADDPRRVLRVAQAYGLPGAAVPAMFGAEVRPAGNRSGGALATLGAGIGGRTAGSMPNQALDPDRLYPVVEDWTAERWRVAVAGQVVVDGPNPYGWIPYVVAPNNPRPNAFWGESDLVDLYDVCRELNARMSVLSRVLELSGAPIAVLENVDGSEGIAVGPGAKWELPEGARAYLLDLLGGGGVGLHVQYVDLLYRSLHDLSETPRTAFGDSGRDLSGAALEVEIQPLVQKVGRKRRGWEAVFRQRNARLLALLEDRRYGGLDLGGLRRTVAIWPDVLPSDADGAIRNQARLVASGIRSRRTAVAALGGDDPEGELARVLDELAKLAAISGQPSALSRRQGARDDGTAGGDGGTGIDVGRLP